MRMTRTNSSPAATNHGSGTRRGTANMRFQAQDGHLAGETQRQARELRPQHVHHRDELAQLAKCHRGRQQHQAADALGVEQRRLESRAPAEAVADHERLLQLRGIEKGEQPAGEEVGVVGVGDRLGGPVAGQVGGQHVVIGGEVPQQREHRRVRGPKPVHQHDRRRVNGTGFQVGRAYAVGEDHARARVAGRARLVREDTVQGQRQRHVAADVQLAGEERLDAGPGAGDNVDQNRQRCADDRVDLAARPALADVDAARR